MKLFLAGSSTAELEDFARRIGDGAYRGRQTAQWMYEKLVVDPGAMRNLPGAFRARLAEEFYAPGSRIAETLDSTDGVEKLRLELFDGESIEMALLPAADGRLTLCLSTQAGCPVGCRFCASGANGLSRNLYAGEMLEEFLFGCERAGRRCDNIVFMGIGEGLLNFDELRRTLEILSGTEYFNLSPRRITVSTSGFVPGMLKFSELHREFNLAVSLHAADDATRAKLIPDKLRYPIAEVLAAADRCLETNGRQYTLEYTLIDGINDTPEMGRRLGELALRHHAKVNLIPYNSTGGVYRRPPLARIRDFETAVAAAGARVTRRIERGSGKAAACGQLRAGATPK